MASYHAAEAPGRKPLRLARSLAATIAVATAAAISIAPGAARGEPAGGVPGPGSAAAIASPLPPPGLAGRAASARAPPRAPRAPIPLAFTVAGGVSLGAYEAGMLHYLVELMKANPGLTEPRLVTGASAGSINGLITILSACAPGGAPVAPEESLLWSAWIPLGFDRLFGPGHRGGPLGAFSRDWLVEVAERLRATWRAGLDARCDVVLGVSVTRAGFQAAAGPERGLALPRVEEKFALRIRGRGPGRPPLLTNYVDPAWPWEQDLLPERPDGSISYDALRDLLLASAAFLIAFAPVPLRHCVVMAPAGRRPRCPAEAATLDLFVDGGLLDNTPLRLAARLAAGGLRDDGAGRVRWLDAPQLGRSEPPPRLLFNYVSPQATSYPPRADRAPEGAAPSVVRLARQVIGGVLATARAKNLSTLLEEDPAIAERIVLPLRHEPAASSPMLAFLGFFEEEFRRFDFTLGEDDVRRMVDAAVLPSLRRAEPAARPVLPDRDGAPGWEALACLRALLDGRPDAGARCAAPRFTGLRILTQASLFRLWDACAPPARGAPPPPPTDDPRCLAARRGEPPPLLPGVEGADRVEWRRRSGEDETLHVTRLLAALRFRWRDLGLGPEEGDEALARLRHRLGELADALAAEQPTADDRILVGTVGGLAANALAYQPPTALAWLSFGRAVELGASRALTDQRDATVRLHAAIELHGALAALSSHPPPIAPALLAGLELRPRQLSTVALQPSALLRAGGVLAPADGLGRRRCDLAATDVAACTRPVVEAGLALSVLESIRLQVLYESYPASRAGQRLLWTVAPSLGVQLPF